MKNIEFAEEFCRVPWRGNMPPQVIELTSHQKLLLMNMESNSKVFANFPRQSGVSTCLAIHIANYMVNNEKKIIALVSPYTSAFYLLEKIRNLLEEYRKHIGMNKEDFYWYNNKEKIKVYGGCEVYIHINMTRYIGSEDADKVEMLVVDNSVYIKNLDKIEEDFKLQTKVKQIIIANTNEVKTKLENNLDGLVKGGKPPLGLIPWGIWEMVMNQKRIEEIKDAIKRYLDSNKEIPAAWITELNERNKKQ